MQTFLPYADFTLSARCLDYKRLGKQRLESKQILNILLNRTQSKAWRNHPAIKMWVGYENALKLYYNTILVEWLKRGYNNTMKFEVLGPHMIQPIWLGNEEFHNSHKSNLLRKQPEYYEKFGWAVPNDLPYVWPTKGSSHESKNDSRLNE